MRLSVNPDDVGFSPLALKTHVYLDGKRLLHCYTADEERGEALAYATHGDGTLVHDAGELLTERFTGVVRLVIEAEPGHG